MGSNGKSSPHTKTICSGELTFLSESTFSTGKTLVWSPSGVRNWMRWLQLRQQSLDHRPRDTPLVEEKQLVCLPLSEAVRRAMRCSVLAEAHMQATPQKQELCDQPVWVWETSSCISLPPVPGYRKGCFTGSLLLHQLQGRKYFGAIKILLVFFYSLLIHAKQESMTHCLLWLWKIQMKALRALRQLCSQY